MPNHRPSFYQVNLGHGFLELPQKASGKNKPKLLRQTLQEDGVFIVDDRSDIYVWHGKKSKRLLQAAADRLVPEIEKMITRPEHLLLTHVNQGLEPLPFKSQSIAPCNIAPP